MHTLFMMCIFLSLHFRIETSIEIKICGDFKFAEQISFLKPANCRSHKTELGPVMTLFFSSRVLLPIKGDLGLKINITI